MTITYTVTLTSASTSPYAFPSNLVGTVRVQCYGPGGNGGQRTSNGGGGGGGGGEYAEEPSYSVAAGASIAFSIPAQGAGSGNTTFNTTGVVAHGGASVAVNTATGGAGGTGSTNTIHADGGAGGLGVAGSGGGGGGASGGSLPAVGGAGKDGNAGGGLAGFGGGSTDADSHNNGFNGGNGRVSTQGDGSNPAASYGGDAYGFTLAAGGGGGGGGYRTANGTRNGGQGQGGFIRLTYTVSGTTQTFDAELLAYTDAMQTFDAALAQRTTATQTYDAALALRTLKTQTFDAAILAYTDKTQTFDAAILAITTGPTQTFDAALALRTLLTQAFDAAILAYTDKTQAFDAALALRTLKSQTFDAVLDNGHLTTSVVIDWAGNGISVPVESIDDVSAYVVGTISVRRGRARITDEIAAGTATFTLRNTDGRFTLLNTSSPLYPYNGYPARYCEINVTYRGVTYPIISGTVSIESQDTVNQTVTCTLVDHFERFRLKLSSLAIQTGKRVDEILTAILDDTNVADPYPKVFDTGPETIGYFTDHNRRLDNALILAAKQDPGGVYFVDRSGNHVYHNRHHAALATTYATFTGNFDSLDPQVKQEDLADTVRATYPALAVDSSFGVVYSQNIVVACPPGTTTFDFEVNTSGVSGASGYVTPLTATTDYVANSESNGSGTAKTGQVTITITSSDSNGGTLSVVNADSSYVYLTSLQVRGYALRQSEVVNAVKVTTTSPVVTGQDIRREFEFQDNLGVVRAWVNREAAVRSGMHVRPILKFAPDTDALMATALGGELNAKIQVTDASAAWLTYVDGKFTIQGIELNINAPDSRRPPVEATWKLFDAQMSGINQFVISPDVGTARSSIAPDSSYSAYDWVAV